MIKLKSQTDIPIIDLGKLKEFENPTTREWKHVADEIRGALGSVGFLYLINHGVPQETISQVFKSSEDFFSLPSNVKLKYKKLTQNDGKIFNLDSNFGYLPPGEERLHPDGNYELKEIFDWLYGVGTYPNEELPDFLPSIHAFEKSVKTLLKRFLRLLAIGLGQSDTDFFLKTCRNLEEPDKYRSLNILRYIRYPPIADNVNLPPGAVRCAEHSDYGFLTFLLQDDVGGLEVKNVNGDWIHAAPIPGSILVNTGDLTEFWTRGIFPATPHRIIIPADVNDKKRRKARYSIAFFVGPDTNAVITPMDMDKKPSEVERLSKLVKGYSEEPVTAYDHMMGRIAYQYRQNYS